MIENADGENASQDSQPLLAHQDKSMQGEGQESPMQSPHQNPTTLDFPDGCETKSSQNYIVAKPAVTEYSKSIGEFSPCKPGSQSQLNNVGSENIRRANVDDPYGSPKVESGHSHCSSSSVAVPMPNKFMSGQNAQSIGPTPTLNQLLQASTPVHRFHSSYSPIGADTYQPWPVQRSSIQPVYMQCNQKSPGRVSPRPYQGSGSCRSPTPVPFQSYSPRFSAPSRSHSPYSHHHHQLASHASTSNHGSSLYAESRSWNHPTPTSPSVSSPASHLNQTGLSPQRPLSQSPAPTPSASPQPSATNAVQELSGQNSNDSSSGLINPATPSSQGLRPTPSPTGSTGSRSLSPAVVSSDDLNSSSKIRKELGGYQNHHSTPQTISVTTNVTNMSLIHEDFPDINSTGWSRTPTNPAYSNHGTQDPYRPKKSDHLSKLYEMDDAVERRSWLDKLVNFMEERRTPITSCPTISKNPLDLFRLYFCVKERGGFMEVCKVTKNKTWKDIAGLLGIGASSSAAYTLRKHYTKHLLAFECHFDRGGIDPQPIINQIEASSKKKNPKGVTSVPSPGSSNSQDSFSAGSSSNISVESYANFANQYPGTPSGPSIDYGTAPPRPPSQSNSPHQSLQHVNYQNPSSFQNYTQELNIRSYGSSVPDHQMYGTRGHYSPYTTDIERTFPGNSSVSNSNGSDTYKLYPVNQQQNPYPVGSSSASRPSFSLPVQPHPASPHQASSTAQQVAPQTQGAVGVSYSSSQDYFIPDQASYGIAGGNQVYTHTGNNTKNMPPPSSGSAQPRRHPDFVKEQSSTVFNTTRSTFAGWSSGSNQYGTTTVRMPFPNQHSQTSSQHQQQHTFAVSTSVASSSPHNNISQQWNAQQNNRHPLSNMNSQAHTSPSWDHRQNQGSSPYSTSTVHQGQLGLNSITGQQPSPKRELTFPIDSVEAVTPVSCKRRKLNRTDIAPVEAWRIMMSLRSGLLAESCWALDVLNMLLFDDSSVHYFGLSHLPGLLDSLLEHFTRSLSDMFDSPVVDVLPYRTRHRKMSPDMDLGAVREPIDPRERMTLLSSPNYTLLSRRGKIVKLPSREEDLFILDHRRSWDFDDEIETDPWSIDKDAIEYIVTCLESEISHVAPATTRVCGDLRILQNIVEVSGLKDVNSYSAYKNSPDNVEIDSSLGSQEKESSDFELKRSSLEERKKNKSINDVISRMERSPVEMDNLTREMFEKKSDSFKKDHGNVEANIDNLVCTSHLTSLQGNPTCVTEKRSILRGAENILHTAEDRNYSVRVSIAEVSEDESRKTLTVSSVHESSSVRIIISSRDGMILRLKVKDPADTLRRRRICDQEDESYSKDDASLYLVTDTQDCIAKRCVCLSTILRNLSFIPGNEAEFSKNITFLSLVGKLLLFHHEHPVRAQKTRNYDREEDADFPDSCSSLQSENGWWWDFLHHVRENVLVMSANIAGHIDLSHYSEEISRPILDGLLHWAICPAANGQDPFPTLHLHSVLSPQRLALEALCKLCVTEGNVDLVIATPPYCRLQKLCSVLSRLLCRSEEQVLREFGINLLYSLSAADSGVARTIALQTSCVALLITFIEQAESSALSIANQHGIAALRDNPESMGTSLDMLRRSAGTLLNLARHPDNKPLLLQYESRFLALVMSQILDQQVAAILAKVLFQCSRMTT